MTTAFSTSSRFQKRETLSQDPQFFCLKPSKLIFKNHKNSSFSGGGEEKLIFSSPWEISKEKLKGFEISYKSKQHLQPSPMATPGVGSEYRAAPWAWLRSRLQERHCGTGLGRGSFSQEVVLPYTQGMEKAHVLSMFGAWRQPRLEPGADMGFSVHTDRIEGG